MHAGVAQGATSDDRRRTTFLATLGEIAILAITAGLAVAGASGAAVLAWLGANFVLGTVLALRSGGRRAWAPLSAGIAIGGALAGLSAYALTALGVLAQPDSGSPVLVGVLVAILVLLFAWPLVLIGAVAGSAVADARSWLKGGGAGSRLARAEAGSGAPMPAGTVQEASPPKRARRRRALLVAALWLLIVAFVGVALQSQPASAPAPAVESGSDPLAAALASQAAAAADDELMAIDDVPVGSCFIEHLDDTTGMTAGVLVVPCEGPHQLEMFGRGTLPYAVGVAYPGDAAVGQAAERACRALFNAYVGLDYASSIWIFWYYVPDATTWELDRRVDCAIGNEDRSMMRAGSARGSAI